LGNSEETRYLFQPWYFAFALVDVLAVWHRILLRDGGRFDGLFTG